MGIFRTEKTRKTCFRRVFGCAFVFTTLAILVLLILASPVLGSTSNQISVTSGSLIFDYTQADNRVLRLATFLEQYNSPLVPYAHEFVAASDVYGIDWKLVPAITGVESTFGKRVPYNSYNAYGWNNGDYRFSSWENSIWHVTKILREKYLDRGADNVWKIGRIYAPPSSTWSANVNFFMNKLEKTPNPLGATLDL